MISTFILGIFFNTAPVMAPPATRPPVYICKHGRCPSPGVKPRPSRPGNTGGRK